MTPYKDLITISREGKIFKNSKFLDYPPIYNITLEPIANSPFDAYNIFKERGMDTLAMGRFLIEK